jgi:drug/metabolite transporter (DMT)-like permease
VVDGGTASAHRGAAVSRQGGLPGVAVAGVTALISGLSVFVNSYGVHSVTAPAVYTTAKNLVATVVLVGGVLGARWWRRQRPDSAAARFVSVRSVGAGSGRPGPDDGDHRVSPVMSILRWTGLAFVGIVGGGLAFVLFFDGLADTTATPAAFMRDSLVIWVAVLAVPLLHERLMWWNVAAIALLVVGEVVVAGGVGHLAASRGEVLVLLATLLWAVEVVVIKVLLRDLAPATVALVRMGLGAVTLIAYLLATGSLRALLSLDATQVGWALLTGLLLSAYVATWMTSLARARALDVTSILVGSALVTALLQAAAGTSSLAPQALGLLLIAIGTTVVLWSGLRHLEPAESLAVRG